MTPCGADTRTPPAAGGRTRAGGVHQVGAPTAEGNAATNGDTSKGYPGGLGSDPAEAATRRLPSASALVTAVSGVVSPPGGGPDRATTIPT
jgi:hypothetical protein